MKYLKHIKKFLMGGLTGSVITMFGPVTPMDIPEKFYTLEELSYQKTVPEQRKQSGEWTFTWVRSKGFILKQKSHINKKQSVPIHHAVYRSIIGYRQDRYHF